MKPPNPPLHHHFLPEFYLKQWAGADGRVVRFTIENGSVYERRVAPKSAGFAEGLYSLPTVSDQWLAQQLETEFFRALDDQASVMLRKLVAGEKLKTSIERSAWTRFLRSLLLRTPAQIEFLSARLRELILADPASREDYERTRIDGEPATFDQWLEGRGQNSFDTAARTMLPGLIDGETVGTAINNMNWAVLNFSDPTVSLLTSDAPVRMSDGHFALPIGPRHLFLATQSEHMTSAIINQPHKQIFKTINKIVVAGARQQVIAADNWQRPFIEKHFGSHPSRLLGEDEAIAKIGD